MTQLKSDAVYVTGLADEIGEDELRNEIFTECGAIDSIIINYDRNGRSQGTATINFTSSGSAQKACQEYDGAQVDGRVMRVKLVGVLATPKVVVKRPQSPAPSPAPTHSTRTPVVPVRQTRDAPRRDSRDDRDRRSPAPRRDTRDSRDFRDERRDRERRDDRRDDRRSAPRNSAPSSPARRSAPSTSSSPRRGGAPVKPQRVESRKPQQKPQQKKPASKPVKPVSAADLDAQMDKYNAAREAAKAGQP